MKASEVIKKLEAIIELYGDADIEINDQEEQKFVDITAIEVWDYDVKPVQIGDPIHKICIT